MNKYLITLPIIVLLFTCKLNNSDNSPPQINEIVVNPSQPTSGQTVTLNAVATDEDGDNLSFNWSVSAGQLENNGIGNPIQWTTPSSDGEINIICVVSDGKEVATKNKMVLINISYGSLSGYVYDDYTKMPINSIELYIRDLWVRTSASGYYIFDNLEIGESIISTREDQYYAYYDTLNVQSGENQNDIYLNKSRISYSGTIYQDSTNNTIGDAQIAFGSYFDSTEPTTDNRRSDGRWQITFEGSEVGNTYNFQISKNGFKSYSDSLTIIGTDTTFITYLKPE